MQEKSKKPNTNSNKENCMEKCIKKEIVEISINGKKVEVSTGQWFIYDLKEMGCIPESHEFAEIKGCSFFEFANTAKTHIKGGEDFKSYPCRGTNS